MPNHAKIICPFFINEYSSYLSCEFAEGDTARTHLWFPNGEEKKEWRSKYCANKYAGCPYYIMLKNKYQ